MANKLTRDVLQAELAAVDALLASTPSEDPLGLLSLRGRREEIVARLDEMAEEPRTLASVALVFDGGAVRGSGGIDADFAGKALQDFQDLVAKQLASDEGTVLGQRGPVPDRKQSRMNVTNVVHGSFGFVLEEDNSDEPQFIPSALRQTVEKVSKLLEDVASPDERNFNEVLERIDTRLFQALRRFFVNLYREETVLKVFEDERDHLLDVSAIGRAHDRILRADVEEEDIYVMGELLGLVPIQRRFDFQVSQTGEVIKGKVGERLSASYLERIHEEQLTGRKWQAIIRRKVVRRPDRRETVEYTLVDLTEPDEKSRAPGESA